MDVFSISASFAAGVVVGILIDKALEQSKTNKVIDKEKLLEECFGDHMYVDRFSLVQAKDWIKGREELLKKGAKALVLKITPETLRSLGQNIQFSSGMENYLAIAVINNATNEMADSILIKYDKLDEQLEGLLAKGDGTLVVGG